MDKGYAQFPEQQIGLVEGLEKQNKTVVGILFMKVLGYVGSGFLGLPSHQIYVSCPLSFLGQTLIEGSCIPGLRSGYRANQG